jgi:FkbM family methyltransferase
MAGLVSYSQRYEDINLLRGFGGKTDGFYIDIGAGHPVFDNVSFAFYLRGWRGLAIEPNPRLAQLALAIRPRDTTLCMLAGRTEGEATFHLVDDYHGLSTTIDAHARSAQTEFGKTAHASRVRMTTLKALCEQHASQPIDLLKIDVEGAEPDVIAGGDWKSFRPKVVIAEALAPFTLAPAWDAWEPVLLANGYRFVLFDSLNRYYVHESEPDIARRLADAPEKFTDVVLFRDFRTPLQDAAHPDSGLARLLEKPVMAHLPLLDPALLAEFLTRGLPAADLDRPAVAGDAAAAQERLFGSVLIPALALPEGATVRDLYVRLAVTDEFRAAIGRISASYAW